jgi:hypothetical protein
MAQFSFDTLAFVKRLSAAGMDTRQAEALAETLSVHALDTLVTKDDLKNALDALELRLTMRMGAISAASAALTIAIIGALITFH